MKLFAREFDEPGPMSNQHLVGAIAGQADWLEKAAKSPLDTQRSPSIVKLSRKRREYLAQLCGEVITRGKESLSTDFSETAECAKEAQLKGLSPDNAATHAVKKILFEGSGFHYYALWENNPEVPRESDEVKSNKSLEKKDNSAHAPIDPETVIKSIAETRSGGESILASVREGLPNLDTESAIALTRIILGSGDRSAEIDNLKTIIHNVARFQAQRPNSELSEIISAVSIFRNLVANSPLSEEDASTYVLRHFLKEEGQ